MCSQKQTCTKQFDILLDRCLYLGKQTDEIKLEHEIFAIKMKEFTKELNNKVNDKDITLLKAKIAELPTEQQNVDMKKYVTEKILEFRNENREFK